MKRKPSRTVYLAGFSFLGFLIGFLAHSGLEIGAIYFLEKDFTRYSMGLTWGELLLLHHAVSLSLAVGGLYFGYRQGVHWWDQIYGKKV